MPNKLLVAVALGLCSGCSMYQNSFRNLIHEPIDYVHQVSLSHALRHEGKRAWDQFAAAYPEWCGDIDQHGDFHAGFMDGFADYLDQGGDGSPPAIPPKRYRSNKYLNPAGFQAIDRYFAGFAAGARMAKESGLRDTLVVPVLVPVPVSPTLPDPPQPTPVPQPVPPMLDQIVPEAVLPVPSSRSDR